MFGPLKEALDGKKFSTKEKITDVHSWLQGQLEYSFFFSRGVQILLKRWQACIKRGGDYAEKQYHLFV